MVCRDTPSSFPKAPWESACSSRRVRITLRICQACFTPRRLSSLLDTGCEFPRNHLESFRASGANSHTMRSMRGEYKDPRSEEHTSELQSRGHLVCRLLLENKT